MILPYKSALAALALFAAAPVVAQAPAAAIPTTPNDYAQDGAWLCRPGRQDACAVDQSATRVDASGKLTPMPFKAAANPKIDCFYVYPTVSADPTPNSDMAIGPEERSVVNQQFARFAAQCRTFAPMYRQVTLTALRAGIAGTAMKVDRDLGYNDVKAAWNDYLARDNTGRGVVLIGHSQGSGVLSRLIKEEIDGKPVQARLVSAMLIGTNVAVPRSADVGGQFKAIPLCRSATQTGCLVTYVSFRASAPPPANSRFGKVPGEGMVAGCTNPAALGGGRGELHSYLTARATNVTQAAPAPVFVKGGSALPTPFAVTPGLLTAECVSGEQGSYLSVTVNADPADPRTDELIGDVVAGGVVQKDWGLHLVDMNIAMGDLVDLAGRQGAAYAKKR